MPLRISPLFPQCFEVERLIKIYTTFGAVRFLLAGGWKSCPVRLAIVIKHVYGGNTYRSALKLVAYRSNLQMDQKSLLIKLFEKWLLCHTSKT